MSKYCFEGRGKIDLRKISHDETSICSDKEEAFRRMDENLKKIDELQQKLYAEKKQAVVILFQAMDAAGKDGTIRSVLQCLSPHGVYEAAFKTPSSTELAHDYLWRIHQEIPAKGEIAIFNRSHYEDVLIGKVKKLYNNDCHADWVNPEKIIAQRYDQIVHFEEYLSQNSIKVIKFFLNVSKSEQAERFLARIEEPEKNWKFSSSDYTERQYWDEYQKAFEDAINKTATKTNPWYIVPADHKWYMRYVVSEIILEELNSMNPKYPTVTQERLDEFESYRIRLQKELDEQ